MATSADSAVAVARGAFPALGDKIGIAEVTIDLPTVNAELLADNAAVIATADVIQCMSLPAGTMILGAGIQIMETVAGATAFEVGLGVTGDDVDHWVTNVDIGSSTSYVATDYLPCNTATAPYVVGDGSAGAASDTIDILCGTVTGTPTAGKLRVFVVFADVTDLTA